MAKRKDIPQLPNISMNHLENYFDVKPDESGNLAYDLTDTVYIDTENMNPTFYDEYEVEENDTLFRLAIRFHGSYNLWWVIASANNIDNPFELKKGDILRILRKDVVGRILGIVSGNDN